MILVSARGTQIALIATFIVGAVVASIVTLTQVRGDPVPTVTTDKPKYGSFETVEVTGANFDPFQDLDVVVVRPDGSTVTGDGTNTPGFDSMEADSAGGFVYYYQLNNYPSGTYTVEVYDSADTSHTTVLATTTFEDGKISTITLRYKDFGFGTPADFELVGQTEFHHFAPGPDSNHGPISVAADGTFTVDPDSGSPANGNNVGPKLVFEVTVGSTTKTIEIHTSCSTPIGVAFLYGDEDETAEDPSEFAPSGPLTAGIEVVSLQADECGTLAEAITVCKDVDPDDASLWDFTLTGPTSGSANDLGDGDCHIFQDREPGSYTLTEATQSGYSTSVSCDSGKGSDTDADITFSLDDGDENVTCTFTNTKTVDETDVKITAQSETAPATTGAGTDFTISVDKTLHNNGPTGPVDVSITPVVNAPADCTVTPDAGNPGSATLSVSTAVNLTENFTVNCTQPSSHVFSIDNCIAITTPDVTDSNTSNNCWPTQQMTVDILDESDIKVTGVTVSSPASANTGASFSVSASADLHNNGGHNPTNVDTSFTLNLPPDCSTVDANPAVVEDTDLPVSTATVTTQISWRVSCSSPSSHQFSVGASATIDELHVSDPNGANNSANGASTTAILSTADLKVSGVTVDAPTGADAGASFVVTVTATLHNNGTETPVNADATIGLSGPSDCTLTPTGGQDQQDLSLSQSTAQDVSATWDVSCTDPSNHQFDGNATVAVDQQHVSDPNPGSNTGSGSDTTAVTGGADVKVTNVTVDAPASESTDTAFDVTVTATVHNNGTFSPVNTATTISLSGPADCTLAPTGGQDQNASLSTGTAVDLVATWQAECSDPSNHQFDGSASVSITDQHVDDPNTGNNIGSGSDTTAIVAGSADVKVSGVTVDAPASANAGSSFVVTVSATVHNNGTLSPVNTATAFSLAAPADCTLTATGGQNQNAALSVSTPVDLSATWDAVCTSPSNHQFDGSASIAITDQHVSDSYTANDTGSSSDTTAVTGGADVKVTDVVVDAPASANVDSPFNVTVTATLHNNGPLTTADADVTIALSGPSDCTLTATGGQSQSVSLAQSVSDSIAGTWSATCTDPSNHQFDGSASVALNQLHVSDPNSANNAGSSADTAAVVASADSKVIDVSIDLPFFAAGDPFVITIDGTIHNNGAYGPVSVDAILQLGLPAECSTVDTNPVSLTGISLPISVATAVGPAEWTVSCTTTGGLTFDGTLTVADTEIHVDDPDTGNNSKSVAVGGGTSTPTPTPPPGGTPNPVGGIAGLLETQENAGAPQNSDAGSGGDLLVIVLATGASLMLAGAAAWASRRSGLL